MNKLLTSKELQNRLFNVIKRRDDGDVAALRSHIQAQAEEIERLREFEAWKKHAQPSLTRYGISLGKVKKQLKEEREACAALAEFHPEGSRSLLSDSVCVAIANDIRAREDDDA